ncbi:MAG TPA: acyl-CoA thioester hydrolase/BAAT C-terminal domain-containing protein [Puia sp.]|nr:acyl-CoA thioester hydrolase/BAAT C-terminal domain-containing protein [Puia sp.]
MDYRFHNEVTIPFSDVDLEGELAIPLKANAVVIFSHGSGSSRMSPRNRMVANRLHEKNFGTLLFDLLSTAEDRYYENRFDIELLTKRLVGATEWLEAHHAAKSCRIGFFGASTGAASALKAASYLSQIKAVVSRGGRPDLAIDNLRYVDAPTLLIVGSLDYDVLRLNKEAFIQLAGEKKMEIIEGATHLFEETGMMDKVIDLAVGWFEKYLLTAMRLENKIA